MTSLAEIGSAVGLGYARYFADVMGERFFKTKPPICSAR
jgi:hypothetical protein